MSKPGRGQIFPDTKETAMNILRRMVAGLTDSSALTYLLPLEMRLDARRAHRNG